jgi:hypothetical protein
MFDTYGTIENEYARWKSYCNNENIGPIYHLANDKLFILKEVYIPKDAIENYFTNKTELVFYLRLAGKFNPSKYSKKDGRYCDLCHDSNALLSSFKFNAGNVYCCKACAFKKRRLISSCQYEFYPEYIVEQNRYLNCIMLTQSGIVKLYYSFSHHHTDWFPFVKMVNKPYYMWRANKRCQWCYTDTDDDVCKTCYTYSFNTLYQSTLRQIMVFKHVDLIEDVKNYTLLIYCRMFNLPDCIVINNRECIVINNRDCIVINNSHQRETESTSGSEDHSDWITEDNMDDCLENTSITHDVELGYWDDD